MAKNSVRDFDATAANNTDIQSVDIAENCAPSGINNAIRELMADIKDVSAGTIALESPQADSLTVTGDLTVDTNTLFVDSTNNNVGIGTSSFWGGETNQHAEIRADVAGDYAALILSNTNDAASDSVSLNFGLARDGGLVFGNAGKITVGKEQDWTGTASTIDSFMSFSTDQNETTTERMRIDSSGNVNINDTAGSGDKVFVLGKVRASLGFKMDGGTEIIPPTSETMAFKTNGSERMRIDSSGNLLVGTTGLPSSTNKGTALRPVSLDRTIIQMSSASVSTGVELIQFRNPNGQVGYIATNASSTTYATSSDYRLKENVTDITDGIERVKQLNPSRFNFIADADTTVDGFLAHEVSDIVPEAVSGEKDAMQDEEYEVTPAVLDDDGNVVTEAVMGTRSVPKYQGIDQSKLVPLLTAALQEAVAKIEALETKVTALEA